MRLGYPCINRSVGCSANSSFRLANYSEDILIDKVESNLDCLCRMLEFNVDNGLFFFRIGSGIIPFASHPVCSFNWVKHFKSRFKVVGGFIRRNGIRISMHPDQFILINAIDRDIVERGFRELEYHCRFLDSLKLDLTAKVQIHVGGVYGDKQEAVERFVVCYRRLPLFVRERLVIENDDRLYSLRDCLLISEEVGVPVVFDVFHHGCLNNGESVREGVSLAGETWGGGDGVLMVDYSDQKGGARKGTHADHIDVSRFRQFIKETRGLDFDIMFELKDKEESALRAMGVLKYENKY